MKYLAIVVLLVGCSESKPSNIKEEQEYFLGQCSVTCSAAGSVVEKFKYSPTGQSYGGYECQCRPWYTMNTK